MTNETESILESSLNEAGDDELAMSARARR